MSAYLTRTGLEQLSAQLSERDLAVIRSVQQHRFLMTRHIEELHFSHHSTGEAGARVCRRVLTRLTKDRLLNRLRRRVGGVRAGSASFVYALGPIGRRLIDTKRRRSTEPSPLFLDHTLAIADAHLALVRADRDARLELLDIEIEPTSWRGFIGVHGAREAVKPDLFASTAVGAYEDCWFMEIDRGTQSPAAITRKCRSYSSYWRTGFEQERRGVFPLVLLVAPDDVRAKRLVGVISGTRNLKRDLFRVTTAAELVDVVAGGAQ